MSTREELRAAAEQYEPVNERLLAACEAALKWIRSQWLCVETVERYCVISTLESAIAAARAQAEDDAKPLDVEWYGETVSGIHRLSELQQRYALNEVVFTHEDGYLASLQSDFGEAIEVPLKTRGDVRRLRAALGISPVSDFPLHAAGATGTV